MWNIIIVTQCPRFIAAWIGWLDGSDVFKDCTVLMSAFDGFLWLNALSNDTVGRVPFSCQLHY